MNSSISGTDLTGLTDTEKFQSAELQLYNCLRDCWLAAAYSSKITE